MTLVTAGSIFLDLMSNLVFSKYQKSNTKCRVGSYVKTNPVPLTSVDATKLSLMTSSCKLFSGAVLDFAGNSAEVKLDTSDTSADAPIDTTRCRKCSDSSLAEEVGGI